MLLNLLTNLFKSHLHIHLFISISTCVLPCSFPKVSHGASDIVLPCSLPSLRPRCASACGSCEHVRMSSGLQCISGSTSHLHPTSSLGLLQLVSEHGISAAAYPHSPLVHSLTASSEERQRTFDTSEVKRERERQRNIFSVNLVEKLRSLGLYKVVARGLVDYCRTEKQDPYNSPPWNGAVHHWRCHFVHHAHFGMQLNFPHLLWDITEAIPVEWLIKCACLWWLPF